MLFRHSRFCKFVCVLVIAVFLHEQLGWTQEGRPVWQDITGVKPPRTQDPLENVNLPYDIAQIDRSVLHDGSDVIINIQDAHASFSAQLSITGILDSLITNYDVRMIAVEGASAGYLDTSLLGTFPDKRIRDNTAEYLMREGRMSAGEFFAVTRDRSDVLLYGVEDDELYRKNLESFRSVSEKKAVYLENIAGLSEQLRSLEERAYPDELKVLERNSEMHAKGLLSFSDYWSRVKDIAAARGVLPKDLPNIAKLLRTIEEEKAIDFAKANDQRKKLIDELSGVMEKKDLEEMVLESLLFKQNKVSQAEFHSYLARLAGHYGLSSDGYPDLIRFTEYVTLYQEIDIIALHREFAIFEERIREKLYRNDHERELCAWTGTINLLEKLYKLEFSNDDYACLMAREKECEASNCAKFIKEACARYDVPVSSGYDLNEIFSGVDEAMDFYRAAEERNNAMLANTLKKMRAEGKHVAALITGGYHTGGLTELMQKGKLSYLVVVPKFETGKERPYVAILTNKRKPYEELLETGRYELAVRAYFDGMNEEKLMTAVIYALSSVVREGRDWQSEAAEWHRLYSEEYARLAAISPDNVKGSIEPAGFAEILGIGKEEGQGQLRIEKWKDEVLVLRIKDGSAVYFLLNRGEGGVLESPRVLSPSQGRSILAALDRSRPAEQAGAVDARVSKLETRMGEMEEEIARLLEITADEAYETVAARLDTDRELRFELAMRLRGEKNIDVERIVRALNARDDIKVPADWRKDEGLTKSLEGLAGRVEEFMNEAKAIYNLVAYDHAVRHEAANHFIFTGNFEPTDEEILFELRERKAISGVWQYWERIPDVNVAVNGFIASVRLSIDGARPRYPLVLDIDRKYADDTMTVMDLTLAKMAFTSGMSFEEFMEQFSGTADKPKQILEVGSGMRRPVYEYFGAMHDNRLHLMHNRPLEHSVVISIDAAAPPDALNGLFRANAMYMYMFGDNRFDHVICANVFNEECYGLYKTMISEFWQRSFPDRKLTRAAYYRKVAAELFRVTKPGGKVFVFSGITHNPEFAAVMGYMGFRPVSSVGTPAVLEVYEKIDASKLSTEEKIRYTAMAAERAGDYMLIELMQMYREFLSLPREGMLTGEQMDNLAALKKRAENMAAEVKDPELCGPLAAELRSTLFRGEPLQAFDIPNTVQPILAYADFVMRLDDGVMSPAYHDKIGDRLQQLRRIMMALRDAGPENISFVRSDDRTFVSLRDWGWETMPPVNSTEWYTYLFLRDVLSGKEFVSKEMKKDLRKAFDENIEKVTRFNRAVKRLGAKPGPGEEEMFVRAESFLLETDPARMYEVARFAEAKFLELSRGEGPAAAGPAFGGASPLSILLGAGIFGLLASGSTAEAAPLNIAYNTAGIFLGANTVISVLLFLAFAAALGYFSRPIIKRYLRNAVGRRAGPYAVFMAALLLLFSVFNIAETRPPFSIKDLFRTPVANFKQIVNSFTREKPRARVGDGVEHSLMSINGIPAETLWLDGKASMKLIPYGELSGYVSLPDIKAFGVFNTAPQVNGKHTTLVAANGSILRPRNEESTRAGGAFFVRYTDGTSRIVRNTDENYAGSIRGRLGDVAVAVQAGPLVQEGGAIQPNLPDEATSRLYVGVDPVTGVVKMMHVGSGITGYSNVRKVLEEHFAGLDVMLFDAGQFDISTMAREGFYTPPLSLEGENVFCLVVEGGEIAPARPFAEPQWYKTPLVTAVLGGAVSFVTAFLFNGNIPAIISLAAAGLIAFYASGFALWKHAILGRVRSGKLVSREFKNAADRVLAERAGAIFGELSRRLVRNSVNYAKGPVSVVLVGKDSPQADKDALGGNYAVFDKANNRLYLMGTLARAPDRVLSIVLAHETAHHFTASEMRANILVANNLLKILSAPASLRYSADDYKAFTLIDPTAQEGYVQARSMRSSRLAVLLAERMMKEGYDITEDDIRLLGRVMLVHYAGLGRIEDGRIDMPLEGRMLVRFRHSFADLDSYAAAAPVSELPHDVEARVRKLLPIVRAADIFAKGQDLFERMEQYGKSPETLSETFDLLDKAFAEERVTDRFAVNTLRKMLAESSPGILGLVAEYRKSPNLGVSDRVFIQTSSEKERLLSMRRGIFNDPGEEEYAAIMFKMGMPEGLRSKILRYLESKGFDYARAGRVDGKPGSGLVLKRWGKGSDIERLVERVGLDGADVSGAIDAIEFGNGEAFERWLREADEKYPSLESLNKLKYSFWFLNRGVEAVILRLRVPRKELLKAFNAEGTYPPDQLESVPLQNILRRVVIGEANVFEAEPDTVRGGLVGQALRERGELGGIYSRGLRLVSLADVGLANGVHCPTSIELLSEIDDYMKGPAHLVGPVPGRRALPRFRKFFTGIVFLFALNISPSRLLAAESPEEPGRGPAPAPDADKAAQEEARRWLLEMGKRMVRTRDKKKERKASDETIRSAAEMIDAVLQYSDVDRTGKYKDNVKFLLLMTMMTESDQFAAREQYRGGPAKGLAQFEPPTAADVIRYINRRSEKSKYKAAMENVFGKEWEENIFGLSGNQIAVKVAVKANELGKDIDKAREAGDDKKAKELAAQKKLLESVPRFSSFRAFLASYRFRMLIVKGLGADWGSISAMSGSELGRHLAQSDLFTVVMSRVNYTRNPRLVPPRTDLRAVWKYYLDTWRPGKPVSFEKFAGLARVIEESKVMEAGKPPVTLAEAVGPVPSAQEAPSPMPSPAPEAAPKPVVLPPAPVPAPEPPRPDYSLWAFIAGILGAIVLWLWPGTVRDRVKRFAKKARLGSVIEVDLKKDLLEDPDMMKVLVNSQSEISIGRIPGTYRYIFQAGEEDVSVGIFDRKYSAYVFEGHTHSPARTVEEWNRIHLPSFTDLMKSTNERMEYILSEKGITWYSADANLLEVFEKQYAGFMTGAGDLSPEALKSEMEKRFEARVEFNPMDLSTGLAIGPVLPERPAVMPLDISSGQFDLSRGTVFRLMNADALSEAEKNKLAERLQGETDPDLIRWEELALKWNRLADGIKRFSDLAAARITAAEAAFLPRTTDIAFTLRELLKNAFMHGNKLDLRLDVVAGWRVEGGSLIMEVSDRAVPGPLDNVEGSIAMSALTQGHGMGLNEMKRLGFEVATVPGKGINTYRAVLPPPAALKDANEIIVVPGHGVYVGISAATAEDDASWVGIFSGEGKFHIEHVKKAVELAAARPEAVIIFSGGWSREKAGHRSEAESYRDIARQFGWWGHPEVAQRVLLEEYSKDSMQNVQFSALLFKRFTERVPEKVTVCGWNFKVDRFRLHAEGNGIPAGNFEYVGVNDPEPAALAKAKEAEGKLLELAKADPALQGAEWEDKRATRDPFGRGDPYGGREAALEEVRRDYAELQARAAAREPGRRPPAAPAVIPSLKQLIAPRMPFAEYAVKVAPWIEETLFLALPLGIGHWVLGIGSVWMIALMAVSRAVFFFAHEGARPHAPPTTYRTPLTVALTGFAISLVPIALSSATASYFSLLTSYFLPLTSYFLIAASTLASVALHTRANLRALKKGLAPATLGPSEEGKPETRRRLDLFLNVEESSWVNPEGVTFLNDADLRGEILEDIIGFLADTWKVEKSIENVSGKKVPAADIAGIDFKYVKSGGEKHVFKLILRLRNQEMIEIAGAYKEMKDRSAVGTVTAEKEMAKLQEVGWTGLVPRFGAKIGSSFFQEWIEGPTALEKGKQAPLSSGEVESIAAVWTRIGRELSKPGDFSGFPQDLNAGNIIYRSPQGWIVVDLGGQGSSNPARFLSELVKYYVQGDHFLGVKAVNAEDPEPVLKGVEKVLGKDIAFDFFLETLMDPAGELRYGLREAVKKHLEAYFEKDISSHGSLELLVKARILKKVLGKDHYGPLSASTLTALTKNPDITLQRNILKQMNALYGFFSLALSGRKDKREQARLEKEISRYFTPEEFEYIKNELKPVVPPAAPAVIPSLKQLIAPRMPFAEYAVKVAPWIEETLFLALPLGIGHWVLGIGSVWMIALMAVSRAVFFFAHEGARPHAPPTTYRTPLTVALSGFAISLIPIVLSLAAASYFLPLTSYFSLLTSYFLIAASTLASVALHTRANLRALKKGLAPAATGPFAPVEGPGGRVTRATTEFRRNKDIDAFINKYIADEGIAGKAVVVDVGVGYPPTTTLEMARALDGKARVIGVDINIPACAVEFPMGPEYNYIAFFDASGEMTYVAYVQRSGEGIYHFPLAESEKGTVLLKAAALKKELSERGGGKDYAEGGASIAFDPVRKYGAGQGNLSFVRGDFIKGDFELPADADIIRAANVIFYYSPGEVQAAIARSGARLKEGGILIIGNNNSFVVYRKKKIGGDLFMVPVTLAARLGLNEVDDTDGETLVRYVTYAIRLDYFSPGLRGAVPQFIRQLRMLSEAFPRAIREHGTWQNIKETALARHSTIDGLILESMAAGLRSDGLDSKVDPVGYLHVALGEEEAVKVVPPVKVPAHEGAVMVGIPASVFRGLNVEQVERIKNIPDVRVAVIEDGDKAEMLAQLEQARQRESAVASALIDVGLKAEDLPDTVEKFAGEVRDRVFVLTHPEITALTPETIGRIDDLPSLVREISEKYLDRVGSLQISTLGIYQLRINNSYRLFRSAPAERTGRVEYTAAVTDNKAEHFIVHYADGAAVLDPKRKETILPAGLEIAKRREAMKVTREEDKQHDKFMVMAPREIMPPAEKEEFKQQLIKLWMLEGVVAPEDITILDRKGEGYTTSGLFELLRGADSKAAAGNTGFLSVAGALVYDEAASSSGMVQVDLAPEASSNINQYEVLVSLLITGDKDRLLKAVPGLADSGRGMLFIYLPQAKAVDLEEEIRNYDRYVREVLVRA